MSTDAAPEPRRRSGGHVTPEDHRLLVEAVTPTPRTCDLPLWGAPLADGLLGAVIAEEVRALVPVPPFTNSAMDGFAVRRTDLLHHADGTPRREEGATLPVSQDVPAGSVPAPLEPGTAARVMTGAPIPPGADTVVRVEETSHRAGEALPPERVGIFRVPDLGANIRLRGEDVEPGALVLEAGGRVDAARLAAAISVGHRTLSVHPLPRVGILTTGSELVEAGTTAPTAAIPDSNGPMLEALVREAGALPVRRERVPDEPDALVDLLADWEGIDVLLTAGGISQGAFEVVRRALGPGSPGAVRLAARLRFHHVAQQPGGPQGVGTLALGERRIPVMCLPGNPVSSFVSFHVHVRPLLDAMAGRPRGTTTHRLRVAPGEGWSSPEGKVQFVPVSVDAEGLARRIHHLGSGSHLVASLAAADALLIVPEGVGRVEAGSSLEAIPTRPLETSH